MLKRIEFLAAYLAALAGLALLFLVTFGAWAIGLAQLIEWVLA